MRTYLLWTISKVTFIITLPLRVLLILVFSFAVTSCAVVTVADAVVTVAATGVKVVAKTTGAVVDVMIPDGDDEDEE